MIVGISWEFDFDVWIEFLLTLILKDAIYSCIDVTYENGWTSFIYVGGV